MPTTTRGATRGSRSSTWASTWGAFARSAPGWLPGPGRRLEPRLRGCRYRDDPGASRSTCTDGATSARSGTTPHLGHAGGAELLVLRIGLGSGAVAALIVVLLVLWGFNAAEYAIDALIVAVPVVYFARTLAARESRPSSAAGCERSSCSSRLRPPSGSPPTREVWSSRCSPMTTRTTRYWASAWLPVRVRGPDLHPRARPRVRLALAEARRPGSRRRRRGSRSAWCSAA